MKQLLTLAILVGIVRTAGADPDPQPAEQADDKTAAAVKAALEADRKARTEQAQADRKTKLEQDQAEARYKKEELIFSDLYVGTKYGVVRAVIPYRNGRRLDVDEFYDTVGRPDLAATYRHRGRLSKLWLVGGTLVQLGGLAVSLSGTFQPQCDVTSPQYDSCDDARSATMIRRMEIGLGMLGVGVVADLVGLYYARTRVPTTENESHDLVDHYNAQLRHKHGLPSADALKRPSFMPYATTDGGGVAVAGRF